MIDCGSWAQFGVASAIVIGAGIIVSLFWWWINLTIRIGELKEEIGWLKRRNSENADYRLDMRGDILELQQEIATLKEANNAK